MADTDVSFYPTKFPDQVNPLEMVGKYQGIQNQMLQGQLLQQEIPIVQQRFQQEQVNTHKALGRQRLAEIMAKNTVGDHTDMLGVLGDAAKDPLASLVYDEAQHTAYPALAQAHLGFYPSGAEKLGTTQQQQELLGQPPAAHAPNAQPDHAVSSENPAMPSGDDGGIPGNLPTGFSENVGHFYKHWADVQDEANSVPQENAALNNILNISKSNVPSGTMIGQIYQALASTGLAPKGIEDTGAQLKLIQNHADQLATGIMPGSDARLQALKNAKVGDKDLPQVIQSMVPYLIAVNKGKVSQAKYYKKISPNGLNPDAVSKAQSNWNQNFDPRLLEMQDLMKDPASLNKYVGGLSKEDKQGLLDKWKGAKANGILDVAPEGGATANADQ